MGPAAARCVARFLHIAERHGVWPPQVWIIFSFLTAKPKGGYRIINMLPSMYILWVGIRRVFARNWEKQHVRRYFAFTAGGGAERTVFRQTLMAEKEALKGGCTVTTLWDATAYYESIKRKKLWER
eukprot:2446718-Lingulodinium_polyedra.AAC.1